MMKLHQPPTVLDLPSEAKRASARDLLSRQKGSFIYFLCSGDECVYVGQSTRLIARLRAHAAAGKHFDSVYLLNTNRQKMDAVERYWIRKLQPRLNSERYMRILKKRQKLGRPSAGPSTLVALRIPDPLLKKIDAWAKGHPNRLNRTQAICEALRCWFE